MHSDSITTNTIDSWNHSSHAFFHYCLATRAVFVPECFSEYNIDLEDVIRDETSGDFTTALLAMLQADKDDSDAVNTDLAREDAKVRE